MYPNGYVLVDCTGLELNDSAEQNVPGIYEKAVAALALGKPAYATNCTMNDGYCSPVSVAAWRENEHTIIATGHVFRVTIADDDDVTVTNLVAG